MKLREIFEAPERTAAMAFGRMNPPTIGHAKLVDAVKSQGADPYIFLSQSQKPKTDPLAFADKLSYAKFFFPEVTIGNPEVKTIIQALQKIDALGYDNLIYVAGSDRVASFEELINKYNGVEYNFKSIKVVSAGERDPDADGAEGMSASKMRQAASDNDLESFKQGVPNQDIADEMFAAVRQGMGITDKEPEMAEGWFGFGEGDPVEAPEWLNDENKALWQEKQPTSKDKRFVTQLSGRTLAQALSVAKQSGDFNLVNQVIKTELEMIRR
jgi:nicotinic acid mononucleotide adenylyltransferase